jgi:translation initiation factor IF-1
MPKDDHIEIAGVVQDAMGGGQYMVKTTEGKTSTEIRAQLSGRMRRNHIRVLPGDKVKVSVSPYDMTHGMITFRAK